MNKLTQILYEKKYGGTLYSLTDHKFDVLVSRDMEWTFTEGTYYERNVSHWVEKVLKKQSETSVFYDIGANIGYYTLLGSSLAKKVFAFEPTKSVRSILKINLRINSVKNTRVFGFALSDSDGTTNFNIYSSSGNNSIFNRKIPKGHELKLKKTQKISVKQLDGFFEKNRMEAPTLIKIDVEGAELMVLSGASNLIRESKPVIICEYSKATSNDAGYNREELLNFLLSAGYKVFGLSAKPTDFKLYKTNRGVLGPDLDNIIAFPKDTYKKLYEKN